MERTDALGTNNLKIIQDTELFCFGTDSVLLANFAKAGKNDTVVDFCTGNGIIPILMSAKTKAKRFYGIEIQEPSYRLACRNAELNALPDRFTVIHDDIKNVLSHFKSGSIDVITCNPPYSVCGSGYTNPKDALAIARHEILIHLEDIITATAQILKFGGHLYLVHRAERICDLFCFMRSKKIEPKRVTFIHPSPEKAPNLVLIDAIYGANPSLKIEKPIYVNL